MVLLQDLLQFGLHVLVHVGFERVLQQDPACGHEVVQPVGYVEHRPPCRSEQRPEGGGDSNLKLYIFIYFTFDL